MNVLGIETSCDETAASVVRDGVSVLSNIISSTVDQHKKYGGIIPEIAARGHLEAIELVVGEAIRKSRISSAKIALVAVASQPGLPGGLLVGRSFARAFSFSLGVPLVEVDHILAHIYAPFLSVNSKQKKPKLPFIGLAVSGGHTSLIYFESFKKFKILGHTRDDAAGEAFDKVAKILGLSYPGGPEIDRLAKGLSNSNLRFKCARLPDTFDFSFSGIKTAVLYFVREKNIKRKSHRLTLGKRLTVEVARAFQNSVVDVLIEKSIAACKKKKVRDLIIGGGVAANSLLRRKLPLASKLAGINSHFAARCFCTDNAAMIAGLGYQMRPKVMS